MNHSQRVGATGTKTRVGREVFEGLRKRRLATDGHRCTRIRNDQFVGPAGSALQNQWYKVRSFRRIAPGGVGDFAHFALRWNSGGFARPLPLTSGQKWRRNLSGRPPPVAAPSKPTPPRCSKTPFTCKPALVRTGQALIDACAKVSGLLTDDEVDTLFSRNPSFARPVDFE